MDNPQKQSFSYNFVRLSPREQIGVHRQKTWELSYIVNGAGTRLIGDRTEPFSRGEVVLIPPGIPHCWYFDGGDVDKKGQIANITITFGDEQLEKCIIAFPEFESVVRTVQGIQSAIKLNREKSLRIISVLEEMSHQNAVQRIVSLMNVLIILSSSGTDSVVGTKQNEDKERERIDNIRTYVICNAVRDISLDDIAKHVGMNRSSFCVFFKKSFGKTFFEYLNEFRVSLAQQMLLEGKLSISEVCFQSGFNGVPYFSRVFKKVTGLTPSSWQTSGLPTT